MQGNYSDKSCRICKQGIEETQKHILQECTEIGKLTDQMEDNEYIFRNSGNEKTSRNNHENI